MRVSGSITTAPGDAALSEGPRGSADERATAVDGRLERLLARVDPAVVGITLFLIALAVYILSNPERQNFYNHFVWQADAYLHGHVTIPYPVDSPVPNSYFQDVLPGPPLGPAGITNPVVPEGQALLPFPPLPAILLLPFVALWGLTTNSALICAVIGALNVSLCWRMLQRVTLRRDAALLGTVFYGFGTVAWYAAMLGSTWFLAHVVASTFLFLGITAALDAERREQLAATALAVRSRGGAVWRQLVAGLLYGTAAVARLTTIFGAPFFVFVGGGGTWIRRAAFAGVGAIIPVAVLLGYNLATTGHLFHPAYDYLRTTETHPVPAFYHASWAIEDPRYIAVNAPILLL